MPPASPIPTGTRTALVWCRDYEALFDTLSRECADLHTLFVIGEKDHIPEAPQSFGILPVEPEESKTLPEIYARHYLLFCEGRVNCFIEDAIRTQHPDLCADIEKGLLEFTRDTLTQTAFRATKGWHLLAGTLLNLPRVFNSPSLENLRNINRGKPAIIVGAGPALDTDAPILAAHKDHAFIIACDAAWNTLINHNIKPDLVVSTDTRDCTWQHLEQGSKEQPDVPVVTLLSGSWSVIRYYPGPLFFARQTWPLDQQIEQAAKRTFPILDTGKCVGNAAFEVAKFVGSNQIIFQGFNLGFEGNRYHPAQRVVSEFHDNPHEEKNLLWVPGNDEEKIRTDYSMFYYLRYFEQQIKASDIPVFNATTGGALINGSRRTSLQKALEQADKTTTRQPVQPSTSSSSSAKPDLFIQKLKQWCLDYLEEIQKTLTSPDKSIVSSGKTPLPALNRHKEMNEVLLSAQNPALSAALQLSWENWCRQQTDQRKTVLLGNIDAYLLHNAMIVQLVHALLQLSPENPRPKGCWISFSATENDRNPFWLSILQSKEALLGQTISRYEGSLDDVTAVWNALKHAEGVIMHNSCLMPFLWAFPGANCVDVIDHAPTKGTLIEQWLPGYSIITPEKHCGAWKERVPATIPVTPGIQWTS